MNAPNGYQFARLKGGYRYHVKQAGSDTALCGSHPTTVLTCARKIRVRAGWMIRKPEAALTHADTVCCKCYNKVDAGYTSKQTGVFHP